MSEQLQCAQVVPTDSTHQDVLDHVVAQLLGDSAEEDSGHQLAQAWLNALFAVHCQYRGFGSRRNAESNAAATADTAAVEGGADAQDDQQMDRGGKEPAQRGSQARTGDSSRGCSGDEAILWGGVGGTPYEVSLVALFRACRCSAASLDRGILYPVVTPGTHKLECGTNMCPHRWYLGPLTHSHKCV